LLVLGSMLKLNPETERFTGPMSKKANRLISRKYRKPFVVPDNV
jgi:hypothetical protein